MIYRPLNKDSKEIRILHLKASRAPNAILDCTLEIVSLLSDPKPEYEAISYCWGEINGNESIRLNGVPFDVPGSAAKVLRRFRKTKPKFFHHMRKEKAYSRRLWIDALCINQADVAERSSQVSMMDKVYSSCVKCLVWLGDAGNNTASALQAVKRISDIYYGDLFTSESFVAFDKGEEAGFDSFLRASKKANLKYLTEFFQIPWFTRAWVLQEVALAPSAICQCGSLCVDWRDVRRAGTWACQVLSFSNLIPPQWTPEAGSTSGLMMTRTIDNISRRSISGSEPIRVGSLLESSAHLNVSDLRDRFYAVLGLVRWDPERDEYMQWLRVDYSLPASAVGRDATRACIIQSQSLHALRYADGQYHPSQFQSASDADLCSWQWILDRGKFSLNWFVITFSCANRPLDLALVRDSAQHKCILLRGFKICEISRLYPISDITEPMTLSQQELQDEKAAEMVRETTRELADGSPGSIKLMRPFLDILTQGTRELDLSGLNDEECLLWVQDFVKYLFRPREVPRNSQCGPPSNSFHLTERDEASITSHCWGRRFFLTACGKIGLGPGIMEKDDCVAALFGCRWPCVLRPYVPPEDERPHLDLEVEPKCYRFLGLAYIPGVMNGEAVVEKETMGEAPAVYELW